MASVETLRDVSAAEAAGHDLGSSYGLTVDTDEIAAWSYAAAHGLTLRGTVIA